ncbi:MAG: hypothetical protein V8T31_03810 [Lachnospiraceae bacterium]
MISILREYVLHAGISMPFSGIEAIQSYYLQAHYALEIGEKENPPSGIIAMNITNTVIF